MRYTPCISLCKLQASDAADMAYASAPSQVATIPATTTDPREFKAFFFVDDGIVPNSDLPVLLYPGAFKQLLASERYIRDPGCPVHIVAGVVRVLTQRCRVAQLRFQACRIEGRIKQ